MNESKLAEFKKMYAEYKQTESYKYRFSNTAVAPIFRDIIKETLNNEPLTNEHLTGFIQMFKYLCSDETFDRYLEINIQDEEIREKLSKKAYDVALYGYTKAGLNSIQKLTPAHLSIVKNFLLAARHVLTVDEAIELCKKYENHNVPQVTAGVYSPWLHYINPEIFPIRNNLVKPFLTWMGIEHDYPSCIAAFNRLKKMVGETQHATLDNFAVEYFPKATGFVTEDDQTDNLEDELDDIPDKNLLNPGSMNFILYGPPGTGKTYITKNLAVQIAENKSEVELAQAYPTREELNQAFKKLQKAGQIGFVTFHQSFGYEDFIEGIKPKMADGEDGETTGDLGQKEQLKYEIKDGIFKIMAERADSYQSFSSESGQLTFDKKIVENLENKQFFKMSLGNTANEDDQVIYDYCLQNNCIALGWGQDIDYEGVKDEKDITKLLEDNGGAQSSYEIFAVKCFILWMKVGDIVFISDGNLKARAIGMIDGDYYYDDNPTIYYKHFRKVKWLAKNVNIPVDQIYGKQFSQQTIYAMYTHLVKKEFFKKTTPGIANIPNHVLIIDEINRGNISSIFGELITLIEPDKRKGGDEFLQVTLPYSKKLFSVPSNLYLIGTMNTADRSVEALDTALRRRFDFLHMQPEPALLRNKKVGDIDLETMLVTINKRLEVLLDADHTIGHAWLMGIENFEGLKTAFKDKILPLLQEFFYNDYEKIGLVLGDGFVEAKDAKNYVAFAKFNSNSDVGSSYSEKQIFTLKAAKDWSPGDFKSIYQ